MGSNVLIFDLGTTLYKVAVFDASGKMLGLQRIAPPISRPAASVWELDRVSFRQTLTRALRDLRASLDTSIWNDIAVISYASQANTFTLVVEAGEAVMPFILWPDERANGAEHELCFFGDDLHRVTGIPRISARMTLAKLRFMRIAMPHYLRHTRLVFLSDDLTFWLTGRHITEAGLAALSGMIDVNTLTWWPKALEMIGMDVAMLPEVKRAGTNLGRVASAVANALGLSRDCQFVVGCLDQYAGAIGTGATEPGDVCETTGTVLAAVRAASARSASGDIFEGPAFEPGRFWQMSFSSTSANLLEWFRNSLPEKPSFEELSRLAGASRSAAPIEAYQEGEPIERCFRNVRPEHTVGDIVRGIMQRVSLALKDQVDALCGDARPTVIKSAGGAARSKVWLDIKSQTLGIPCVAVDCEEPTSLGAAKLALRAITSGMT